MNGSRHIYLVDNDDFGNTDGGLWTALFTPIPPQHENQTFGQLVHLVFPNLKYIMKFDAPPLRGPDRRDRTPNAYVYISDQNVIQTCDIATIRKMIRELPVEYRGHKKRSLPQERPRESYATFEVERLNRPDAAMCWTNTQDMVHRPHMQRLDEDTLATIRSQNASFNLLVEAMPLNNVALLSFGKHLCFRIHLLTASPIPPIADAFGKLIRKTLMYLFWLLRQTVEEEPCGDESCRLSLTMDSELSPNPEPYDGPDIKRVKRWVDEVR